MMVNSTLPAAPPTSSSSNRSFYAQCQLSVASQVIFLLYTFFTMLFLLPLFLFVLYTGAQRWRHRRSAGTATSSTDFFTYHMMLVELCGALGSVVYAVGDSLLGEAELMWGAVLSAVPFSGQILFHVLTCVERYLAVVHPIAYVQVGETVRVRTRTISTGSVWLLCLGWTLEHWWHYPDFPIIPLFSMMGVCVCVIFGCCVCVLRVLVRPGPAGGGGDKQQLDQSKKRAFQMMAAITGALTLRSLGFLFWLGLVELRSSDVMLLYVLLDSGMWLTVPSSLVLPLLFLHRAGKLSCSRRASGSGF